MILDVVMKTKCSLDINRPVSLSLSLSLRTTVVVRRRQLSTMKVHWSLWTTEVTFLQCDLVLMMDFTSTSV